MNRIGIVLLLTGMGLVLGSCVPVVQGVFQAMYPETLTQFSVTLGSTATQRLRLIVPHGRLALRWQLAGEETDSFRLPYRYSLHRADGTALQQARGVVTHNNASVQSSTGAGDSIRRTIEKRFDAFAIPQGGELKLDVALDTATGITDAHVIVYSGAVDFKVSFLTALILWVLGISVVLIGGIMWIRAVANVPGAVATTDVDQQQRMWGMFVHLAALLGYLGLPFGHIIGPLVVWMAKRDYYAYVDQHGRESLNFQLSVTLYAMIGLLLTVVLVGFLLLFLLVLFHVAMTLYAALRSQQGDPVRYPLNLRIIAPPSPVD